MAKVSIQMIQKPKPPLLSVLMEKYPDNPDAILDAIYIRALSRTPSARERARLHEVRQKTESPRAFYNDVLWTLLNSSEFIFNH